jgi:hypothetical protein
MSLLYPQVLVGQRMRVVQVVKLWRVMEVSLDYVARFSVVCYTHYIESGNFLIRQAPEDT